MYSLLLNVLLLCGVELLECPKLAYLYLTSRKERVRLGPSSWHCYRFPLFLVSGILLFPRLKKALSESLGLHRLQYPWQTPPCAVAEGFKRCCEVALVTVFVPLCAVCAEGLHVAEGGTV